MSGFLDAAAVTWFLGEPYWTVWGQRLFSNILAHMTIDHRHRRRRDRPAALVADLVVARVCSKRRRSALGVIAMGSTDFGGMLSQLPPLRAVSSQAPLALQLPFLLWAAVRFGIRRRRYHALLGNDPRGVVGRPRPGPVCRDVADDDRPGADAVAHRRRRRRVLSLSALVDERRQTQSALAERLVFEELLARLSGAFVKVPSDRMDAGFDEWLGQIGAFLNIKCVASICADRRRSVAARAVRMDASRTSSVRPPPDVVRDFPWSLQPSAEIAVGHRVVAARLPPEAAHDLQIDGALWLQGDARAADRLRSARARRAGVRRRRGAAVARRDRDAGCGSSPKCSPMPWPASRPRMPCAPAKR